MGMKAVIYYVLKGKGRVALMDQGRQVTSHQRGVGIAIASVGIQCDLLNSIAKSITIIIVSPRQCQDTQ